MSQQYGSIPTTHYLQREAARAAGGSQITFTTFAVGDGNGAVPALTAAGTGLVHEVFRAAVASVAVNPDNATQVDITCLIPDAAGSFTIREVAVFDETGAQCVAAITNIVKLSTADGQTSDLSFIVSLAVGSAAAVVVFAPDSGYATRSYVDTKVAGITIPAYTATEGVKLGGAGNLIISMDVPDLPAAQAVSGADEIPLFDPVLGHHKRATVAQLAPAYSATEGVKLGGTGNLIISMDVPGLQAAVAVSGADQLALFDPTLGKHKRASVAQLALDADFLNALVQWLVPTGTVIHVAQTSAPQGYLKANGAAVSRTTYAALFAELGTAFGGGDGSTTFNLPDLRGEFVRGFDDGRGIDANRTLGSEQAEMIGQHTHPATTTGTTDSQGDHTHTATSTGGIWNNGGSYGGLANSNVTLNGYVQNGGAAVTVNHAGAHTHNLNAQTAINNNTGTENRPRNVALLACIKF